jgi:hypothetical protein
MCCKNAGPDRGQKQFDWDPANMEEGMAAKKRGKKGAKRAKKGGRRKKGGRKKGGKKRRKGRRKKAAPSPEAM